MYLIIYLIKTFPEFLLELINADINSWDCLTLVLLSNFGFAFVSKIYL